MEADFKSLMLTPAAIVALVGARVYPQRRTQADPLPALVYRTVSAPRDQADDGPIGLVQNRMQVDCHARTYTEAKRLARAVILALENARGIVGDTNFRFIQVEDERDNDDAGANNPEAPQSVSVDFMVWSSVA